MARLRPTLTPARADHYARRGGPWNPGTTLDQLCDPDDPGALALVDGTVRLSAGKLDALAGQLAGALHVAGVGRRDVVAWQLPNCSAAVLLYRACWRLGAIAAPLHHRMGATEVAGALTQVEPAVVISAAGLPLADVGTDGYRSPSTSVAASLPAPPILLGPSSEPLALFDLLPPAPPLHRALGGSVPEDLAVCLFTSGSTGVPKAALHTHRGLAYKATLMQRLHGLPVDAAVLTPAPLAHVSGLLNGVLISAATRGACVLMDAWDPERALDLIETERVEFMGAPPVFFSQMTAASSFSAERVASVQLISTGGASVSPAFVEATADAFQCRVKRTYGSTEAPTVATSGPEDPVERGRDTDGRATGEVDIEIREPATGAPVASNHAGELWIRGPELFVGYVDPAATAAALGEPGGWYRSGDLGTLDGDGWLRIVGRLSDVIIRAGENISASEVEAALEAHPAIRQAVAVGVPDERVGERVAAFVVSEAPFSLDDCRAWFEARGVTRYKTPEFVQRIDEIPALAAGKPDRAALRRLATAGTPETRPGVT